MALYNSKWKQDSGTQISIKSPSVTTLVGTASVFTIAGGSIATDTLALQTNISSLPRTARIKTDPLEVFSDTFDFPSGSSANFSAVRTNTVINNIDVSNPNVTTFQIAPTWSHVSVQSWGLLPKTGFSFSPTLSSSVNSAGSDSVIFLGANFQPQVNGTIGPRTTTNLWAVAGDPRQTGTSGSVLVMYGVRSRGNTISGGCVSSFYGFIQDGVNVAGGSLNVYNGMYISPTLTGATVDFNGVYVVDKSGPTGTNIAFRHGGGSVAHSRFQGNVQIGADTTPADALVVTKTRAETSGTLRGISNNFTLAPTANSTSTSYGFDTVAVTSSGASNPATTYIGGRFLAHRNATDTGSITTMRGLQLQALNTAALGTGQGGVVTLAEGAFMQAFDNSSTTTSTVTIRGAQFDAALSTNVAAGRVVTNMQAGYFTVNAVASSSLMTVQSMVGIRVAPTTDAVSRTGRVVDAYGIYIGEWNTGAGAAGQGMTYVNPPEQLRLAAMTVASSIGIRQIGATPVNRLQGATKIGADSSPLAILDVAGDILATQQIRSSGSVHGIGYATGAGSLVGQATNKSTAVTCNTVVGQITMNNAALGARSVVSFTVNNNTCSSTDIPVVAISSGGTANAYTANVTAVAASSFAIQVANTTGGSLSESPVVSFALIRGVTS